MYESGSNVNKHTKILKFRELFISPTGNQENMRGEILALFAALLWGIAPLFDRIAIVNISPLAANFVRALASFSILLIYLLVSESIPQLFKISTKALVFLIIAGIMAGAIAGIAYYYSLKMIGAAKTVPLTSVYPLITVVLAAVLLGESVSLRVYIGAVLIVAGVILVSGS